MKKAQNFLKISLCLLMVKCARIEILGIEFQCRKTLRVEMIGNILILETILRS